MRESRPPKAGKRHTHLLPESPTHVRLQSLPGLRRRAPAKQSFRSSNRTEEELSLAKIAKTAKIKMESHRRGAEDAEKRERMSDAGVPSQRPNRCADFGRCPFPAGLRPPARLRRPSSGKASFPARRPAQRARVGDAGWNGQLEGAGTRALPPTLLRSADGSGPSPLSDFTARHLDVQKYDSVPNRSSFADRAHSRRNAAFQAIMDRPKVHARAGLRRSSIAGSYSITWSLDHRATARTRHKTLDTRHRPPPGGHLQLWLEVKPVRGHYNKHLQENAAEAGGGENGRDDL